MNGFTMTSVARAVPGNSGDFSHRFGGLPSYSGIVPRGARQPLHLLPTFDTTDPLVPVQLKSARVLPLFYGFPYNAGAVGYRVVSDNEIKILFMESLQIPADFPYPDYPERFPEIPISLLPISYEEHKPFHSKLPQNGTAR